MSTLNGSVGFRSVVAIVPLVVFPTILAAIMVAIAITAIIVVIVAVAAATAAAIAGELDALLEPRDARIEGGQLVRIEPVTAHPVKPLLDIARFGLQAIGGMVTDDVAAIHEADPVLQRVDPLLQLLDLAETGVVAIGLSITIVLGLRIILGRSRARQRESRTSGGKSNH